MKKIVFTGGHHTSALVVAQELKRQGQEIFWFGHRRTMVDDPHLSLEYQEVTQAGIKFYNLLAGKFQLSFGLAGLINLIRIPIGFIQALVWLLKLKPDLIVCFGGYLGLPTVIMGRLLGIPSLLHEQTLTAGRTNRWLVQWSKKVLLAWPEAAEHFPKDKTLVVGLPLRPELVAAKDKKIKPMFKNNRPTIYLTGGKQGAQVLNQTIEALLPQLLAKFNLIHQSGQVEKSGDYQRLAQQRQLLPAKIRQNYWLQPFFSAEEVSRAFSAANLVISRAGAHTIYELAWLAKPAILIPLPFSYAQEQELNAQKLVKLGLAEILSQDQLNPASLWGEINRVYANLADYRLKDQARYQVGDGLGATLQVINSIFDETPT